MNKHNKPKKPRTIALKKETLIILTAEQMKNAPGGNNSTIPSQCPTLCFT